jgi:hypothetical protein
MERRMFSVKPDQFGWVLAENDEPVSWFRTRHGAVVAGDVKAYAVFEYSGEPSALSVFMDDTVSVTAVRYG